MIVTPVRTSPPVLLARHSEVSLPNGGCSFEVSCAPDALLKSLSTEPLLVELYHKDKYATDVLLGIATVDLTEVLGVPPRAGKPGDFPRPAADQVAESLVRSLELHSPTPDEFQKRYLMDRLWARASGYFLVAPL